MKRLCLIISVLIFGITALSFGQVSNKWKASITITSDSKSCIAYFGTHPAATDGFDTSLGDYNDIPLPPGFNEALRAIFVIEGLDLYQDIRPIGTWTLSVTSQKPFSLSWNISEVPENVDLSLNLGDRSINMRQQSSVEGLQAGSHTYTITGTVQPSVPKIEKISGDNQTGSVGISLPNPIVVRVLDQFGSPMAGVTVTFTVTAGNGSADPTTVQTDDQGKAQTVWTLGPDPGENKLRVTADVEGIEPVEFTATGVEPVPTSLEMVSGDGQEGAVGKPLPNPLVVLVKDQFGAPMSGVTVAFSIVAGDGSVDPSTATTNNEGKAQTVWTLGPNPGENKVQASVDGIDQVVTFTATGIAPVATTIEKVSGDNQYGYAGEPLADPIVVVVKDQFGNPMSGVSVSFAVITGGGTVSPSDQDTNEQGKAQANWTLGPNPGKNEVQVSVSGLSPVIFTAEGTLRPSSIEKVSGDDQTGVVGTDLPESLVVLVKDQLGNPLPGATATFTVIQGDGKVNGENSVEVQTGVDGKASVALTLGTTAGTDNNIVQVSVEGVEQTLTFTASAQPGPAATVTVTASPDSLRADGSSTSTVTATVKDIYGNLIPTETVTVEISQGSGSLGNVTNNNDGTYTATYTASTTPGTVIITATTSNGKTGSVTLTLTSPNNPPYITSVGGKPPWESHAVEAGSQLTLVVEAVDPDNDPITYSALNLPAGSSFDSNTHTFTWTPTDEQVGTYTVRFVVSDGELVDESSITINVTSRLSLSITSPPNGAVIKGLSVDVSGSVVGATSVTINGEAATISDGTFSGTVTFTDYGDQTVQVTATAADGRTTSATVSVKLVEKLIKSVTVAGSPAKAGSKITVTAETETSGTAAFSIEGVPGATDISMAETAPNAYEGEYTVSAGEDVTDATVTVSFTNALGQTETDTSQKVTIDTQAAVTSVSVKGSPAKAGDKITVTVVAEPNGTATFSIEDVSGATDVPMAETDGTYVGEYAVQSGDNVRDADVTVSFTDALGNSATMTADQKVTIDTTPPTISSVQTDKESVRNGESFTLTVKTEPSVSVSVDVSDLDTTKTEPIQLQEIQDGIYEVEMTVSEQNKADEGVKTLVITAADSLGNTSTAQVTVELKLTSELTLQLRKGLNLLSVPVKPSDTFTLADLMGMMGDGVRFIIRFDPDKRKFVSYLPGDPKAAEVPVRGCDGYLTALDEPVTLKIEGEAWDGEVKLMQGINMIAVPLMPPEPITIADMIAKFGENVVTLVVYLDPETGKFKSVTPQTASEVTVQGGAGYIVIAQTEATATFEGKAWANTSPPSPAAPIFSSSNLIGNSPLLVVEGTLTGDVTDDGIGIRVENLSGGVVSSSETENGRFTAILMGLNEAYSVGDVIKITAEVPKGYMAEPIFHRITFEEIESGVVSVKLTLRRIPDQTMLLPNYPNPFNPETWIPFQLAQGTEVTIRIYDLKGRLVRKLNLGYRPAGIYADRQHAAYWDGRNELGERVASGIYIYRMKAGDKTFTRRMTIIK